MEGGQGRCPSAFGLTPGYLRQKETCRAGRLPGAGFGDPGLTSEGPVCASLDCVRLNLVTAAFRVAGMNGALPF